MNYKLTKKDFAQVFTPSTEADLMYNRYVQFEYDFKELYADSCTIDQARLNDIFTTKHQIVSITTNEETALALEKHANWCALNGSNKSYKVKAIRHEVNYSVVLLEPTHDHKTIDPSDLFFLGYHSCLSV